jgi:hypothetical protein
MIYVQVKCRIMLLSVFVSSFQVDSSNHMDGTWRSNDGDMSIAASSEPADQSIIREEFDDNQLYEPTNTSPPVSDDGNNSDIVNNNNGITDDKCSLDVVSVLNCIKSQTHASGDENTNFIANHATQLPISCNGTGSKSRSQQGDVKTAAPSRLLIFAWAFVFAILFVVAALAVFAFVILEFDTDVAVIGNIQRLPEVCAFRREQYLPWRNWILPAAGNENRRH